MQFVGQTGPFLVVAPLTTLGHWLREIQTWTDLDVVQYTGSGADRCGSESGCAGCKTQGQGSGFRRAVQLAWVDYSGCYLLLRHQQAFLACIQSQKQGHGRHLAVASNSSET